MDLEALRNLSCRIHYKSHTNVNGIFEVRTPHNLSRLSFRARVSTRSFALQQLFSMFCFTINPSTHYKTNATNRETYLYGHNSGAKSIRRQRIFIVKQPQETKIKSGPPQNLLKRD